jgi:hypothetical protein
MPCSAFRAGAPSTIGQQLQGSGEVLVEELRDGEQRHTDAAEALDVPICGRSPGGRVHQAGGVLAAAVLRKSRLFSIDAPDIRRSSRPSARDGHKLGSGRPLVEIVFNPAICGTRFSNGSSVGEPSCHTLSDMLRQYLVDQGLIADLSSPRLLTEPLQNVWIHTNRNQPTRDAAYRWAAHSAHCPQLLV